MTYYKTSKKNHTPISDAAIFFSNKENYDRVFGYDKSHENTEKKHSPLEKVKEILNK